MLVPYFNDIRIYKYVYILVYQFLYLKIKANRLLLLSIHQKFDTLKRELVEAEVKLKNVDSESGKILIAEIEKAQKKKADSVKK